ncbi:predicted protein [Streptomyces sp. SPB78]|nr:predicted protein [Streptomyces sp. SPB78]
MAPGTARGRAARPPGVRARGAPEGPSGASPGGRWPTGSSGGVHWVIRWGPPGHPVGHRVTRWGGSVPGA